MIPYPIQVVMASTLVKSVGCGARIIDRYYHPSSIPMESVVTREAGLLAIATVLNLLIQRFVRFTGRYALLQRAAFTVPGIALAEIASRYIAYRELDDDDDDDIATYPLVHTYRRVDYRA